MARPLKQGIDYFPLNVDFFEDLKIRKINRACGIASNSILIYLLCNIYRENGYYVDVDEDLTFLVADTVGTSEGAVIEVINKAIQVDFFDKEKYAKYKILTSKGIQQRFKLATYQRKNISLQKEYLISCANNEVNHTNNEVNHIESTQSKVKESKENISLSNIDNINNNISSNISLEEREKIFNIFFFKNYINPEYEVERFVANYASQNWIKSNGQPITSKSELAKMWKPEDTKPKFNGDFLDVLKKIYKVIGPDCIYISQISSAAITESKITILCSEKLKDCLERNIKIVAPIIREKFKQDIIYKIIKK